MTGTDKNKKKKIESHKIPIKGTFFCNFSHFTNLFISIACSSCALLLSTQQLNTMVLFVLAPLQLMLIVAAVCLVVVTQCCCGGKKVKQIGPIILKNEIFFF